MNFTKSLLAATVLTLLAGTAAQAAGNFQLGKTTISGARTGLVGAKTVALTFDDGPGDKTGDLLDFLKKEKIHASFFMVGRMIPGREHFLERMRDEGHTLANHTYDHKPIIAMSKVNIDGVYHEIKDADDLIAPFVRPGSPIFFRAPGGSWKDYIAIDMNSRTDINHYIGPVWWDVGGTLVYQDANGKPTTKKTNQLYAAADWDCWLYKLSTNTCAQGYVREIERFQGGIVLFHDSHDLTIEMLKQLVPTLRAKGYKFVSMEEMPAIRQFEN